MNGAIVGARAMDFWSGRDVVGETSNPACEVQARTTSTSATGLGVERDERSGSVNREPGS